MSRNDLPQIAILGAGPIGLEAALYAATLHFPVTVYERQQPGAHVQRWGHVRLFSPFGMNHTSLGVATIRREHPGHTFPGEAECITGRDHLACYLEPLAQTALVRDCIRTGETVVGLARRNWLKGDAPGDARRAGSPFLIQVRNAQGQERIDLADILLDCTGTYAQHRWLGEGGLPALGEQACAERIAYGLEDVLGTQRAVYANRTVLVLGAGYSAATSIGQLATLAEQEAETWILWSARGTHSQPIRRVVNDALPERDRLAMRANMLATRAEGNVEFHGGTVVERLESTNTGVRVTARTGEKTLLWDVDRIIANVGYTPDTALYRELQVHECYASLGPMALAAALLKTASADCLAIPAAGAATLRNPEPGFYLLGAKSYGRNSHFLLRAGFQQVRDVFTLITGKPDLNLYEEDASRKRR